MWCVTAENKHFQICIRLVTQVMDINGLYIKVLPPYCRSDNTHTHLSVRLPTYSSRYTTWKNVCQTSEACVFLYLWVCQASVVGFEVVDDALGRSGQGGTAHQQHKQHDIWEGGCQVHHLECTHGRGGVVRTAQGQRKQEGHVLWCPQTGMKY